MAVSKIWPVKTSLNSVLEYAKNKEKTGTSIDAGNTGSYEGLERTIQYAVNDDKTQQQFFVTGINCDPETACSDFIAVKKMYQKEDGILAWHGYLSFDKGEVTPQQAQEIGVEFVQKVWGERFQAVVTTHLNTEHLHCHFVINSVSFVDGLKMHDEEKAWIHFSKIADEICWNHHLSVIDYPSRHQSASFFNMKEKQGVPTRKSLAKEAIDKAIASSRSFSEFCIYLEDMGYRYNFSRSRQYWTITAPEWKRPMRLYQLGEDYSNERIIQRIEENRKDPIKVVAYVPARKTPAYHLPSLADWLLRDSRLYKKYLYYCYLLGKYPKYRQEQEGPFSVPTWARDELTVAEQISEETRLLCREKLKTTEEVEQYQGKKETEKQQLTKERDELRKVVRRKNVPEDEKKKINEKIDDYNQILKTLRKEIFLCKDIVKRSDERERKMILSQDPSLERGRSGRSRSDDAR